MLIYIPTSSISEFASGKDLWVPFALDTLQGYSGKGLDYTLTPPLLRKTSINQSPLVSMQTLSNILTPSFSRFTHKLIINQARPSALQGISACFIYGSSVVTIAVCVYLADS